MSLSEKNIPETGTAPAEGRPFSERCLLSANSRKSIRINTDSILVPPPLEQVYHIMKQLSSGGNAVISIAEDKVLKRIVVLKSLNPDLCRNPKKKRAFIQEAQILAQLEHPSIVPVYGIVQDANGGLHIAMKQIRGISLRDYLRNLQERYAGKKLSRNNERKSLHERLELFIRICDAVSFAHSKQVLHGDLKPGNIMIENSHNIYIMDWGNAEILRETQEPSLLKDSISGTPGYLSPEAIRGEYPDCRSEVFTLGLILFEIVTLSKAVTGKTQKEILLKIRDGKRNPIRHKFGIAIAPFLRGIIKKALHPDKCKRYDSVAILAEELRNYLTLFSCSETK